MSPLENMDRNWRHCFRCLLPWSQAAVLRLAGILSGWAHGRPPRPSPLSLSLSLSSSPLRAASPPSRNGICKLKERGTAAGRREEEDRRAPHSSSSSLVYLQFFYKRHHQFLHMGPLYFFLIFHIGERLNARTFLPGKDCPRVHPICFIRVGL